LRRRRGPANSRQAAGSKRYPPGWAVAGAGLWCSVVRACARVAAAGGRTAWS